VKVDITLDEVDDRPTSLTIRVTKGGKPTGGGFTMSVGSTNIPGRIDETGVFGIDPEILRRYTFAPNEKEPPWTTITVDTRGYSDSANVEIKNPPAFAKLWKFWADEYANAAKGKPDTEVATGTCDPSRWKLLKGIEAKVRARYNAGDNALKNAEVRESKILVAVDAGTKTSMSVGAGTDTHVIAIGLEPVKLDVKHATKKLTVEDSEYQKLVSDLTGPNAVGKHFASTPGDDVEVTVSGHGCALVLLLRKF
jgi:hypothetical protein